MKRLMDLSKTRPQWALGAVAVLLVMGLIAFSPDVRPAEAVLQPNDEDGLTLNTNVILGPSGVVRATLMVQDDTTDALEPNSPQLMAPDSNVDATGQVPGGALPAGIAHVSCVIADGTNDEPADSCIENPGNPANAGPVGCDFPVQATFACIQYGDRNGDADTVSGTMTLVADITITCDENNAVPITGRQPDTENQIESTDTDWVYCLLDPTIEVTKVFEGEPADAEFDFTYNGPGCFLSIDGVPAPPAPIADGEPFSLMNGETAELFCGPGVHTVTETNGIVDTFNCDPIGDASYTNPTPESAEITLPDDTVGEVVCIVTNTGLATGDVVVEKVCVDAEELDGTFSVALDDGEPVAIACGDSVTFEDVEAGPHTLTETIEGDDAEDFETVIICNDGVQQVGTTAEFDVVAGEDQTCLVINGADITDLLCDCPCGCGNIEIDLDNTNTNVIGIENENENKNENNNTNNNENNNTNTNTQDQHNTQDQTNSNTQTNNITSSPEVNIDFD
jgi:hypothetical protein